MPSVFQLNIILPVTTRPTKRAVNMSVHIKKFRFAEISAKAGSVTRKEGYCLRTDNTDLRLHKTVNSEQNVLGIAVNTAPSATHNRSDAVAWSRDSTSA